MGNEMRVDKLREFVNRTRIKALLLSNRPAWIQLCSCMDTLEDTEAAIAAFARGHAQSAAGYKYLAIYGVLQALFVQQDAVEHLYESFGRKWIPADLPELREIRESRNCSIGHPTKQ